MSERPRARDLGVEIGLLPPGPLNAITDVAGVRVGHSTIVEGEGALVVGRGPVRTGVTVVVPWGADREAAVFCGTHTLNGNGEMTGLEWIRESGLLSTPIAITNTHSVGVVRDALIAAEVRRRPVGGATWSLPVVAETWDGILSDIDGQHVRAEHVFEAVEVAAAGPVAEGNVGGGTGMICHELKGGIGTSSRIVQTVAGGHTVGVLVQANYGRRERLTIAGVPVGLQLPKSDVPSPYDEAKEIAARAPKPRSPEARPNGDAAPEAGAGSIIVIVATDAPLLPHQCRALAERAGLGIARAGGAGERTSGDIFLAFTNANVVEPGDDPFATRQFASVAEPVLSELFWATVEATEEAIVNALVSADTMTGRDRITAHALPHDVLRGAQRSRSGEAVGL